MRHFPQAARAMKELFKQNEIERQASVLYGFAFYSVWTFVTLHNVIRMAYESEKATPSLAPSVAVPIAIALIMLLIALRFEQAGRALRNPAIIIVLSLFATAGSIAMVFLPFDSNGRMPISLGTQALFEIVLLLWFRAFANFELEIVMKKLPGILALAGLFCGILVASPQQAQILLLVAAACAQTGFLLVSELRIAPAPASSLPAKAAPLARTLVCASVFSLMVGFLLAFARFNERDRLPALFYYFFLLEVGLGLFGISCAVFASAFRNRTRFSESFSYLPALSIGAFLGVIAAAMLALDFERVLSCIGLSAYNMAFILLFLLMSKHFRCSDLQLFAYGRTVYQASLAVAYFVVLRLIDVTTPFGTNVALFILVIACQGIVCVAVAAATLVRRENLLVASLPAFAPAPFLRSMPDGATSGASAETIKTHAPATTPEAEAEPQHGKLKASAIARISQNFKFSERETEVFTLFVKGRSIKRVAEELYLSIGTVNTYLRRIYQKTEVHSRQELLDLFESEIRHD